MCEAATRGARHVQDSYKECEAATMGTRHVRGSYKGCKACARQLQGV